jgi:hypothetical protein
VLPLNSDDAAFPPRTSPYPASEQVDSVYEVCVRVLCVPLFLPVVPTQAAPQAGVRDRCPLVMTDMIYFLFLFALFTVLQVSLPCCLRLVAQHLHAICDLNDKSGRPN